MSEFHKFLEKHDLLNTSKDFKDGARAAFYSREQKISDQKAEIDQLKAEVENLKNPSLVLHTKKYREQCEVFESLSDAEKKAYGIGYEWACKVSQQQILTLIQDHESIEDRSDKKIEKLKAEKVGLEKRLNALHVLARMRSAVITADRWSNLRPHIKNAIKRLDRKEKALRGGHE